MSDIASGQVGAVWHDWRAEGAESPAAASSARYSPDATFVAAVVDDEVVIWDVASLEPIRKLARDDPESNLLEMAFSSDDGQVAVRGTMFGSDVIDVYEVSSGEMVTTCCEYVWWWWTASVEYSPDGKRLPRSQTLLRPCVLGPSTLTS